MSAIKKLGMSIPQHLGWPLALISPNLLFRSLISTLLKSSNLRKTSLLPTLEQQKPLKSRVGVDEFPKMILSFWGNFGIFLEVVCCFFWRERTHYGIQETAGLIALLRDYSQPLSLIRTFPLDSSQTTPFPLKCLCKYPPLVTNSSFKLKRPSKNAHDQYVFRIQIAPSRSFGTTSPVFVAQLTIPSNKRHLRRSQTMQPRQWCGPIRWSTAEVIMLSIKNSERSKLSFRTKM